MLPEVISARVPALYILALKRRGPPISLPKLQRTLISWVIGEIQSLLPRILDLRKRLQHTCTWDPLQLGYLKSFRSRDDPAEHVTLKQPSASLRYLGITCTVLDFDLATSTSLQLFSNNG